MLSVWVVRLGLRGVRPVEVNRRSAHCGGAPDFDALTREPSQQWTHDLVEIGPIGLIEDKPAFLSNRGKQEPVGPNELAAGAWHETSD